MISLEQVQLLESKVAKAIEYVKKTAAENAALVSQRAELQAKIEANQKRIDELEVLVMRFKEDQGRIEDGIIAALDRLSQFEEAFEKGLKEEKGNSGEASRGGKKPAAKKSGKEEEGSKEIFFEIEDSSSAEKDDVKNESALDEDDLYSDGELDIF